MKIHSLWPLTVLVFLCGCVEPQPVITYHQPLTSPGGQFSRLPPAVQNSVRAEAGMAEIEWVYKEEYKGAIVYEVRFKNHEIFPPLYLAPNGSVLNPDLTVAVPASEETIEASTGASVGRMRLEDLPPNVVLTVKHAAPTAEVDSISRHVSTAGVFYEFTFKGPMEHPAVFVRDDGRLVQ